MQSTYFASTAFAFAQKASFCLHVASTHMAASPTLISNTLSPHPHSQSYPMRGSGGGPVYFEITSSSLEHASSESRVRQALGKAFVVGSDLLDRKYPLLLHLLTQLTFPTIQAKLSNQSSLDYLQTFMPLESISKSILLGLTPNSLGINPPLKTSKHEALGPSICF